MASGARNNRTTTTTLSVRAATLRDLDILVHQRRDMWIDLGIRDQAAHETGDRAYKRWAESRIRNRQLKAWIAENRDGRVVGGGCLWLQPVQPSPQRKSTVQPYLLSMYTEPEFRRQGVASMIVNRAIEWCRRKGYGRLRLHASKMGRNVYGNLGFKRGWEMRLDLDKPSSRPSRKRRNSIRRKT